jgi:signal transduction histidine kinase
VSVGGSALVRSEDVNARAAAAPVAYAPAEHSWRTRAIAAQLSPAGQLLVAIGCAACAVGIRYALDPWLGSEHVYTIAFAATAVAALVAGWRAGLLCAVLAEIGSNVLFLDPRGTYTSPLVDAASVTFYLMTAVLLYATRIAVESHRAFRILVQRLDRADKAKSELLALIAHELRNPLSAIELSAHCLRVPGADPAMAERALGAIERQTRHIARLVEDLTDASRVEAGKVTLKIEHHALDALLSNAGELVEPALRKRRQVLRIDARPGLRARVDGARIVQVLANLLHNASKYSPEGSTIWMDARAEASQVCIKVTDKGMGIPREQLESVFDSYAQLTPGSDGLGLGLSLVRKLVQLHSGTIRALSRGPGEGSTFEICLPAAAADSQA